MRITGIKATYISIPKDETTYVAAAASKSRDYVLAQVETDEGISGAGYSYVLQAGRTLKHFIEDTLRGLLVGEDPLYSERLWEKMYYGTLREGRKGLVMKAISIVDIALWDIKCKAANLPLYQLLGGFRDRVPAYASEGVYYQGKGPEHLAEEMAACAAAGFKAVKMKVGRYSARDDEARVRAAREAVGDDVDLLVDAVNAWRTAKEAIRVARLLEPYNIFLLEEPVMPDNVPALAEIAAALDTPVAVGETESGRWGFRDLILHKAADIIQPDATTVGGISEWLKIANMATCWDIPIAPHRAPEIHVQLAAATARCITVEYFSPSQRKGVVFHRIQKEPLVFKDGMLEVSRKPGVGLDLDWEAVEEYRG